MNYETINAQSIGKWPLAGAHDPALDNAGIPDGASLYGLFEQNYTKLPAPESIPGLTQVSAISELKPETYCLLKAPSGFDYIVALTDNDNITITVKREPPKHTETVRIYHIPDCKMVSSKLDEWDSDSLKLFDAWMSKQTVYAIYSFDFLTGSDDYGRMRWMYVYDERMDIPDGLEIIDFKGGYYAVVTAIDGNGQSHAGAMRARDEYLKQHGLVYDKSRWMMGHVLSGYELMKDILDNGQMDFWTPIKKL